MDKPSTASKACDAAQRAGQVADQTEIVDARPRQTARPSAQASAVAVRKIGDGMGPVARFPSAIAIIPAETSVAR